MVRLVLPALDLGKGCPMNQLSSPQLCWALTPGKSQMYSFPGHAPDAGSCGICFSCIRGAQSAEKRPCCAPEHRPVSRAGAHTSSHPLQQVILNVSRWFPPSLTPCLGQASTPAVADGINNGHIRGHCPTHHLPWHSSSLPCCSSSQAGPPGPAEHPVHPLSDRLCGPGLGGGEDQRTHGPAV